MGLFSKWEHKGSIYQKKTNWEDIIVCIAVAVFLAFIIFN